MTDLENMDPGTARVFTALRRTIHLHKHLMVRELAKKDSHPAEMLALGLLLREDGLTQRDLAERLHMSRPWVTRMLQVLERSGEVVRQTDAHDQRLVRVFLTDRGKERERELRDVWFDYLDQTIGTLSNEEKVTLEGLLNKLNAGLGEDEGRDAEGSS